MKYVYNSLNVNIVFRFAPVLKIIPFTFQQLFGNKSNNSDSSYIFLLITESITSRLLVGWIRMWWASFGQIDYKTSQSFLYAQLQLSNAKR